MNTNSSRSARNVSGQHQSNGVTLSRQVPPPPEIFEIGRGIQEDSDEDSLESVASRISAWTEGAAQMNGGKDTEERGNGNGDLTDVQLDETKNKYNMHHGSNVRVSSGASVVSGVSDCRSVRSTRSGGKGRAGGSLGSRTPSLRDVTRASSSLEKSKGARMSRQPPRMYSRQMKFPRSITRTPEAEPELTESNKGQPESSFEVEQSVMDPEALKFDSIASKYMWDMETEDETLSSVTIRENTHKRRIVVFCYITTFAAFIFGVLLAYTMFAASTPSTSTPTTIQARATSPPDQTMLHTNDITVDDIMPYLQKLSGAQTLADDSSPQNHALLWLQQRDTFIATSTDKLVQRYVVATFFFATQGLTAWDLQNKWLTPANECDWDGITCFDDQDYPDVADLLEKISLPSFGLSGTLPLEIGNLAHLRNLTLPTNSISGPIPSSIVKLTNLLELNLSNNALDGNLPTQMETFKSLIVLNLSNNKLKGKIPPALGNLASLQSINFKDNAIDGIIPLEFLNLIQLKTLNLAMNQIVGVIPKDIDNLSELQHFNVANNAIFGQIPDTFGNILTLKELNLSHNVFTGDIPTSLSECESLKELDLSHNSFEKGQTVPSEICLLKLDVFTADCIDPLDDNYVDCECCTSCSRR